jgi:hypothetical protein
VGIYLVRTHIVGLSIWQAAAPVRGLRQPHVPDESKPRPSRLPRAG